MNSLPVGPHRVEDMAKYCLETAARMLEAHGGFAPWAAVIDHAGDRHLRVGDDGTQGLKTAEAYALIEQSMRAEYQRGEIIAGALVAQASVPPEFKPEFPDAVRVVVESGSISRLIFLPFSIAKKKTAEPHAPALVEFGELIGVNVRPTLFARS